MKQIIFLLSALLLLLGGCSSDKKVVVAKPKMVPSWYTNPPKSNERELYALGEGENQKEAIANALAFMVSTLSVSVSSSFDAEVSVREGAVESSDKRYLSKTTTEVKEIRISSYELLHSKSLGFKRYGVLVKSNKKKLFLSMKKEIEQKFTMIEEQERVIAKSDAIARLAFYRKTRESLKTLPNTLLVMDSLEHGFEAEEYIRKTQLLSASYQELAQSISFSIESNSAASNLKAPIAKGLSDKHFKLKNSSGKKHFNIDVKTKVLQANSYGFTLARSEISIVTKDYRGVIVGSNVINIVGQSSQGYEVAKQNVAYRLNTRIAKEGIAKVLGLDI